MVLVTWYIIKTQFDQMNIGQIKFQMYLAVQGVIPATWKNEFKSHKNRKNY